jgi:ABC-type multidrug transport system fused ATPase/permease subunit
VERAAKDAMAHDFILATDHGYDTVLGDQAARLSGGQRQRIAIARAILRNAPIVLLDEATSSLDSESEHQIQLAFDHLMEGRTTVVIAHRLSTVLHADKFCVLVDGRIVEEGRHDELMALGRHYARFYRLQFRGRDDHTGKLTAVPAE